MLAGLARRPLETGETLLGLPAPVVLRGAALRFAGPEQALQQQPQEPDDWRIGVHAIAAADQRYRYGVLIEVDGESYRVRFDDSEKSVLVPVSGHAFDWVQPDGQALAKRAQKGKHLPRTIQAWISRWLSPHMRAQSRQ